VFFGVGFVVVLRVGIAGFVVGFVVGFVDVPDRSFGPSVSTSQFNRDRRRGHADLGFRDRAHYQARRPR
jgi:hypothetical protein